MRIGGEAGTEWGKGTMGLVRAYVLSSLSVSLLSCLVLYALVSVCFSMALPAAVYFFLGLVRCYSFPSFASCIPPSSKLPSCITRCPVHRCSQPGPDGFLTPSSRRPPSPPRCTEAPGRAPLLPLIVSIDCNSVGLSASLVLA